MDIVDYRCAERGGHHNSALDKTFWQPRVWSTWRVSYHQEDLSTIELVVCSPTALNIEWVD